MNESGIVFGNGFLGNRIADSFGFTISPLRIQDYSSLRSYLEREKPKVVINAVGKTRGPGSAGIDWCELNQEQTFFSNVVVPGIISLACYELGIYFVHLSTGGIYQGDNGGAGFSEEDEANFTGTQFYAKTKADAEKLIRNLPGLIIRIRSPIDDRPHQHNLIDKLIKYPRIINLGSSATTVPHMIKALGTLIDEKVEGTYNVVNPGIISPAEIMQMYRELVDIDHKFEVIGLDELKEVTQVARSVCVLDTRKLESKGIKMPEIKKAVEECLVQYRRSLK